MAREFSFEEAIAPPAKASAPREFSFEEAVGAKPAPKVKAKPTAADAEFDFDTPISGEFGGADIMKVADTRERTGSVFDTQPFESKYNVDYQKNLEAMQRSGSPESVMFTPGRDLQQVNKVIAAGNAKRDRLRAVAEAKAAKDQAELEERAKKEDYGVTDFGKDVGLGLSKGVVGLGQVAVGAATLATGFYPDNPLGIGQWSKMMKKLGYDPELTKKFITGFQSATSQTQQQEVEAAQGFINTFKALVVNPLAITDSVMQSLPNLAATGGAGGVLYRSILETAAKDAAAQGLKGMAAQRFITEKVKDSIPKVALAASAAEGAITSSSIAEQASREGRSWGQYVAPALAAGFGTAAIGAVSGKVGRALGIDDVETAIAAQVAGVKGASNNIVKDPYVKSLFKTMTKEGLLEELPQSAQEQIFTNLATGRPWDEGVGKAAAQGLVVGAAQAGGHVSVAKALQRTGKLVEEQIQEMKLQEERGGLPMTAEELARSKGFLGGPKKSIEQLIEELDALVQKEQQEEEAKNAGQTITEPSGESISMADESGRREPTGGLDFLEPDGMVPTGQDVTGTTAGEGREPTAVTPLDEETKAQIQGGVASIDPDLRDLYALQLERKLEKNGVLTWKDIPQDLNNAVSTVEFAGLKTGIAVNPLETIALIRGEQPLGETLGTTTTETKQAETQGQETAPAAIVDLLDKYFTPDSALHKFYKALPELTVGTDYDNPLARTKFAMEQVNNALNFVSETLQKTGHPSVTAETPIKRAYAKSIATPDIKFLHQTISQLSGLGVRIANQGMAVAKQYKGKKAVSLETLQKSINEFDDRTEKLIDELYLYGLLSPEVAAMYEEEKGLTPKPTETPTPPAETADTPTDTTPSVDELFPSPKGDVSTEVDVPEGMFEKPAAQKPAEALAPPAEPAEPTPYFGAEEINVLGKKIADMIESVTSDFMVGDMVKFGNTSGVVVGIDGEYARVHPDGAKSPKAYQRLPKKSLTFIARPDTTSTSAASRSADQDKKFGSEQGKLNADMGGLIQLLGANMYASSIAEVSVKELLQNAFDAVKGAVSSKKDKSLYKTGKITIEINDKDRTITVTDNARGMTPEIVRDAFFTVAGSDKSDLDPSERSGGLGLAKMGFMLGAERLILDTVRNGVRVRVDTTAKDIANSNFKINKSPAPKNEHGTSVTVKIPEYYIDPKTGDKKDIFFSSNIVFYDPLKKPLIGPVEVEVKSSGYRGTDSQILPVGINFKEDNFQKFKVDFSWGSADVYFGKTRIQDQYNIKHEVLSSGVYQFNGKSKYNPTFPLSQTEAIPFDIIINIKPNVDAKHPDYPFENSRERFKARLDEDIDSMIVYLAQIARGNEAQEMQDNFKNIVSMPRMDVGQDIADASNKLHKAFDNRGTTKRMELPPMPTEVKVVGTTVVNVSTGQVLADSAKKAEKQKEGTFKAEQAAPDMKDFMLKMAQNPSQPIFHNNTNINYIEIGKQYGNPEVFFAELGTLMVEMKEALADSGFYGYDVLKAGNLFFGGISIDKGYGGVHIKVPYKAVLLNPFYDFGAKTLFGAAEFMWETMTHEVAHTGAMSHGEAHNTHMLKVRQYLADEGLRAYFYDAITDILRRHESTFTAMREAYGRSTTANTGKSLDKYGDSSTSVQAGNIRSSGPDELGTVPTGGRRGGDGDIRAASEIDSTVGFRREDSPESVKGLHQDVVNAINNNDINGALKALSRNTSGLYSELANRLAELNLPTSITFGQTADLLHRSMNITVGQQQIRLFAYLGRQYPDLYDKYFKNYDRSENLEKVYAGLQALEKGKYNLDPVIVEFREVASTFSRNMKGLKTPGMYVPNLDTVSISPNKVFGSSNQVLLHEIVHAATEYMLRGGIPNQTTRQYQAVSNLYQMYKDAQEQLPPGDYGFTNIFEFVAEVMTNPNFQKKLSTVYYRTEKASMLNSMYRYIMSAVGLGNLAGAAMKEVNEIMSAYRPAGAVNAPLRFAKRIRGPISTPDTYRTAESVQKGIQYRIAEATAGRMTIGAAIGDLKDALWDASGYAARATVLPFLQLRQLSELTRTRFPQITAAIRIVSEMVSYRGKKIKIAEDIIQLWDTAQGLSPEQSKLMSRIMIEATIRGIDPDTAQATALNKPLADAWNALDPEFKTIYRKVRDFYADSVKEMVNDMKLKARAITDPIQRQKVLDKIDEQFGPDKLASPYFPLRRFGNFWFQIGSGNFKEFYTFENPVSRNLAFLARRRELENGNAQQRALAKTIFKGNGISELYGRNAATTQILRDVQDLIDGVTATDVAGLKSELNDSLNQLIYLMLPQQSMRKMFINRKAIQGASSDMLRVFAHTAVHSAYQQARFKYSEPFINNLNNARSYIRDIPNPDKQAVYMDYVQEVENRTKNVLGIEDKSVAAQIAGSVTNTVFFFVLSAPASALVNILGASAVTMPYIGSRYGYAKTNASMLKNLGRYMASIPTRTLKPIATGHIMQTSFPSIVEGGKLSPLLQEAAKKFIEDGDINISMTNDIYDLGERPSSTYTGTANVFKKILAGPFHQAERMVREVSLLTTFELAHEKFMKEPKRDLRGVIERDANGDPVMRTPEEAFDDAIEEARDIAGMTLGDYVRQMKGRVFTYPGVNVVMQFKQYAIQSAFILLRNHYLAFSRPFKSSEIAEFRQQLKSSGMPPDIIEQRISEADRYRKELGNEAYRRLAGILGMTFLYGGVVAQPYFSVGLGTLIKMFAPDDDDEFFDWENWFANYMNTEVGGAAGAIFAKMGMETEKSKEAGRKLAEAVTYGPVSAITGSALSDRVSLDLKNLWYREGRYDNDARQAVTGEIIANLGPAVGLGLNWVDAYQLVEDGQFGRAYEKAVPAIFAKPVTAYRISQEGATTRGGDIIGGLYPNEFTLWDISMQAIGLQPLKLYKAQKSGIQGKTYQQKVLDKHNSILNRLWMERGTPAYADALDKAREFTLQYPDMPIDSDAIDSAFDARAEAQAQANAMGARLDEKLMTKTLPMLNYGTLPPKVEIRGTGDKPK